MKHLHETKNDRFMKRFMKQARLKNGTYVHAFFSLR